MAILTGVVLNSLPSGASNPGTDEQRTYNTFFDADSTSATSHTLEVRTKPYVVRAYDLGIGEYVSILNVAGSGSGTLEADLYLNGTVIRLTETNNTVVLDISGRYKFRLVGALGEVTVVGHETDVATLNYGLGNLAGTP